MREMKDSGVEWIGEIPADWTIVRVSHLFANRKNPNRKGEEKNRLSLSYGRIIRKDINSEEGLLPESFNTYNIVEPGDIIIRPTDLQNDKRSLRTGLSKDHGIITSAYIALKPITSRIDSRFYYYLLHSYDIEKVFYNMGNGVRQGLTFALFAKLPIVKPSLLEQQSIADYLDSKCSQIDFIVEKTRQEIEKLKEYRQSMITEAVTKGLDPDVEMKDSGVEWIGKIPSSWKIGRVKNILDYADKYPIGDGDHGLIKPTDYKDSGIPYIRVQNLTWEGTLDLSKVVYISSETNQKIRGSQLKPNDILIAKTGATIGKVGIIPNDMPISNTTSHVGKITISKKHNPSFLLYVLSSNLVREQLKEISAMQSTRPELGISNMKNLVITIPSRDVQDEIAITLSRKTAQIDLAVRKQYQLIDKLQEYKKSLIYECVTGKKEVASNARSV